MILHILVGDLHLESFPKKTKWLKLQLFADDTKEYGIHSDQFYGENIVRFNQTIHCPIDEFESVITKVSFVIHSIQFDGTHTAIGSSSLLCSSMEQATTKSIVLHNKLEAYVGRLTVTVFYNESPIEMGDEILTKQNNYTPNHKEYAFLLSRRQNRVKKEHQPISFNSQMEDSVNQNIAEQQKTQAFLNKMQHANKLNQRSSQADRNARTNEMQSKLFGGPGTSTIHGLAPPINQLNAKSVRNNNINGYNQVKVKSTSPYDRKLTFKRPNVKSKQHYREEPKLRETAMTVGYVHNKWPNADDVNVKHEKTMYSLFLAEERRLALLREVNEEVKYRNKLRKLKSMEARAFKARDVQRDTQLQSVLDTREDEIKKLRDQLYYMKHTKQQYAYGVARETRKQQRRQGHSQAQTSDYSMPHSTTHIPHYAAARNAPRTNITRPFSPNSPYKCRDENRAFSPPPRSPASQLNPENSMALRILQRSLSNKELRSPAVSHRAQTDSGYSYMSDSGLKNSPSRSLTAPTLSGILKGHSKRRKSASDATLRTERLYHTATDSSYNRTRHSVGTEKARSVGKAAKHVTNGYHRTPQVTYGGSTTPSTYRQSNAVHEGTKSAYSSKPATETYYHRIPTVTSSTATANIGSDWLASARASVQQLHMHNDTVRSVDKPHQKISSIHPSRHGKTHKAQSSKSRHSHVDDVERTYPQRHFGHGSPRDNGAFTYSESGRFDDDDSSANREDTFKYAEEGIHFDSSSDEDSDVSVVSVGLGSSSSDDEELHHIKSKHDHHITDKKKAQSAPLTSKVTVTRHVEKQELPRESNQNQFKLQHSTVGNIPDSPYIMPAFLSAFTESTGNPAVFSRDHPHTEYDRVNESQLSDTSFARDTNNSFNMSNRSSTFNGQISGSRTIHQSDDKSVDKNYTVKINGTNKTGSDHSKRLETNKQFNVEKAHEASQNGVSNVQAVQSVQSVQSSTTSMPDTMKYDYTLDPTLKGVGSAGFQPERSHSPLMMQSPEKKEQRIMTQFEKNKQYNALNKNNQSSETKPAKENESSSDQLARMIKEEKQEIQYRAKLAYPSPQALNRGIDEVVRGIGNLEARLDKFTASQPAPSQHSNNRRKVYQKGNVDSSDSDGSSNDTENWFERKISRHTEHLSDDEENDD